MLPSKTEDSSAGAGAGIEPAADGWSADSAAEATHRIANHLSLLVALVQLHGLRLKREGIGMSATEAASFLDEVASRIETVARLHRLLSTGPEAPAANLADYMRELCDTLAMSLASGGTVEFLPAPGCACNVSPDEMLPIALIVNEAVNNAIRYAHPPGVPVTIRIVCREGDDGALAVTVEDDGAGLPAGLDPASGGGLGFQAMRLLARQLEAELTFESGPTGLRCAITLPRRPT